MRILTKSKQRCILVPWENLTFSDRHVTLIPHYCTIARHTVLQLLPTMSFMLWYDTGTGTAEDNQDHSQHRHSHDNTTDENEGLTSRQWDASLSLLRGCIDAGMGRGWWGGSMGRHAVTSWKFSRSSSESSLPHQPQSVMEFSVLQYPPFCPSWVSQTMKGRNSGEWRSGDRRCWKVHKVAHWSESHGVLFNERHTYLDWIWPSLVQ